MRLWQAQQLRIHVTRTLPLLLLLVRFCQRLQPLCTQQVEPADACCRLAVRVCVCEELCDRVVLAQVAQNGDVQLGLVGRRHLAVVQQALCQQLAQAEQALVCVAAVGAHVAAERHLHKPLLLVGRRAQERRVRRHVHEGRALALARVQDSICKSDGSLHDLIIVGGGTSCRYKPGDPVGDDFFISMQGREVYKHAVRQMSGICQELLERNGLTAADVDLFVPHQANMRIIEAVGSRLKIGLDHVFTNVAEYGNTSSASVPLALVEAMAQGRIKAGDRVLVTAFGSGLTWGAALLQF